MLIYNSDKPHNLMRSFKSLLSELLFVVLAALIVALLNLHVSLLHILIIPAATALIKFIYTRHDLIPNQVIIDSSKREIRVSFNSAMGDEDKRVLPFDICRLRVERYRPLFGLKKKTRIIFYKKSSRQFEISSTESGFSESTLENLGEELDKLTHKTSK